LSAVIAPAKVDVLVFDPAKCTGCGRCALACSLRTFKVMNPAFSAIRVVRLDHEPVDAAIYCQQCGLCIDACPEKAIYRDPKTFAVIIDRAKCKGLNTCNLCAAVCPIGAINFDPIEHKAFKCDLCGGNPNCVRFCPTGALKFVKAEKAAYIKSVYAARLHRLEIGRTMIPYPRRVMP